MCLIGRTCLIRFVITRAYRFSTCQRIRLPVRFERSTCFRAPLVARPWVTDRLSSLNFSSIPRRLARPSLSSPPDISTR